MRAIRYSAEDISEALADTDQDVQQRTETVDSIGKIGGPQAVEALVPYTDPENEKDLRVRRAVVSTLSEIGDESIKDVLAKAMNDEDNFISLTAAEAVGRMGDPKATQSLINLLKNEDSKEEEKEDKH